MKKIGTVQYSNIYSIHLLSDLLADANSLPLPTLLQNCELEVESETVW